MMAVALGEARAAASAGEVPVGAVLLEPGGRIHAGRNRTRETGLPSSHAEFLVLSAAAAARGDWRLEDCTLYSTLEPCLMCAGLALIARVPRIVYGAWDRRFGAFGSVTDVLAMPGLNHYPEVLGGCLAGEASGLLRGFFREARDASSGGRDR